MQTQEKSTEDVILKKEGLKKFILEESLKS